MKLLIDESVDVDLRHELVGHDAYTVITTDRNIEHQQQQSRIVHILP